MFNNENSKLEIPQNPGDLSQIRHLAESKKYKVEVKRVQDQEYQECFVYETDNYAGQRFGLEKRMQQSAAFTYFSFCNTQVNVRITCNFMIQTAMIRPQCFGILPVIEENVVTFILDRPRKISIEINDRKNPLFLFADIPDQVNKNATYYYGPGVHEIGLNKIIHSGESVYIAAGAVVQGTFKVDDYADHVRIQGRGIINVGNPTPTNDCRWLAENCTISAKANHDLLLEGVILTNACAWTISVTDSRGWDMPASAGKAGEASYNNSYRNLKLISWNGNSDGIWFDGDNALIDDCFIFNNDDGITTHGSHNCKISNIVFWGGTWGRFFMHCDWSSSSELVFEHINIIGKEKGPLIKIDGRDHSESVCELKNITFRDIHIEDHEGRFLEIVSGNKITNMVFENMIMDQKNPDEGIVCPKRPGSIDGLTFINCKAENQYITAPEKMNLMISEDAGTSTFIVK